MRKKLTLQSAGHNTYCLCCQPPQLLHKFLVHNIFFLLACCCSCVSRLWQAWKLEWLCPLCARVGDQRGNITKAAVTAGRH